MAGREVYAMIFSVVRRKIGNSKEEGVMRTEQEMYNLIINTAKEDDRILAVYMNGSRTNTNVPKDMFQDYNIVYVVKETKPYYENEAWIDRFGERLYM